MEQCYNLNQVAELLGVKVRTLRQWISTGKLNATKITGTNRWIVTASEIERLQGSK